MFSYILYGAALGGLAISYANDKKKTKQALMKAWKPFNNLLPDFAGILALIGLVLTVLSAETISQVVGAESGFLGMVIASLVGAITLIPGFIAFPMASSLLERGAGVMQVGVFVSTLMMVGFITLPLERKHFGPKVTYLRNALSFVFSFIVAIVLGMVIK